MSKMIPDPEGYFSEFVPQRDELLKALEEEAQVEGIPIIGPVMGELLHILARSAEARMILELGTATGYSAIHLARACQAVGGRLITVEWDREMAKRAETNLHEAGLSEVVEVMSGDANELLSAMQGPFDLIFMDIDKEYYVDLLPHCHRILRVGGLLVTDNVGFQSSDRFNREIFSRAEWKVVHLLSFLPGHSPEKDGLSLALRVE